MINAQGFNMDAMTAMDTNAPEEITQRSSPPSVDKFAGYISDDDKKSAAAEKFRQSQEKFPPSVKPDRILGVIDNELEYIDEMSNKDAMDEKYLEGGHDWLTKIKKAITDLPDIHVGDIPQQYDDQASVKPEREEMSLDTELSGTHWGKGSGAELYLNEPSQAIQQEDGEVPEEIREWITDQLDRRGILAGSNIFKEGAIAMYKHLQSRLSPKQQEVEDENNAYALLEQEIRGVKAEAAHYRKVLEYIAVNLSLDPNHLSTEAANILAKYPPQTPTK